MRRKQTDAEQGSDRRQAMSPPPGPAPDAGSVEATMGAAVRHFRAGRLGRAEATCEKILEIRPPHLGALHLLGVIALQTGRSQRAVDLIGKAVSLRPDDADAHRNLGAALGNLGRIEEAIAAFRRAIALKPGSAETHYNLGIALAGRGELDEAVGAYRKAIALRPDYAEAYDKLGNALMDQGNLDEAVAACRNVLALNPANARAHRNLGIVLNDLGKDDEAVASHRRAIAIEPDYAKGHRSLGNALKDQGKPGEALASYRKAIALDPDDLEAQKNIFRICFELGETREAVKQYQLWKSRNASTVENENKSISVFSSARMRDSADYTRKPYVGDLRDASVLTSHWLVFKDGNMFYDELLNRSIFNVPFIEAVAPDGRIFADIPKESCFIEDPCILLGGDTNYYLWMIDFLPRLAVIAMYRELDDVPLLINSNIGKFQEQSLDVLGIPLSRMIKVDVPGHVRCKHLFVPTSLLHHRYVHRDGVNWLRQSFNHERKKHRSGTRKRLFVSRQDATRRRLLNEEELIDALAPLGFEVVNPERLHFKDQIKAFSEAELILGPHGAGFTNMIFAPSDVNVIEIQHKISPSFGMDRLAQSLGISFRTIFGEAERKPHDSSPLQKQMADFSIDIETVLNEVQKVLASSTP